MIKKILSICGVLALCACIAVVPCFAIQSGWYSGQEMIHILGGQYQITLYGTADDALVVFDTRAMYWYDDGYGGQFESVDNAQSPPDMYLYNLYDVNYDDGLIYNDATFEIEHPDFPADNTVADVLMTSDRFTLGGDAKLGLHLNPIFLRTDNDHVQPVGDTVSATVHFYALTVDGEVIDVPYYRNDLIIGGTYDLTARFREFFVRDDIQYYWITYEGNNVVPSFVQDFSIRATMPWTDVRVVDWATDIVYPEVISYEDFNLLSWLGSAIDGFLTTTIFTVGGIDVTLGVIVSIPLTIMILIVFLKKFAGG